MTCALFFLQKPLSLVPVLCMEMLYFYLFVPISYATLACTLSGRAASGMHQELPKLQEPLWRN